MDQGQKIWKVTEDEKAPLIAQILRQISEAAERKRGDQAKQLRMTAEDVTRWALIGAWCQRAKFHY